MTPLAELGVLVFKKSESTRVLQGLGLEVDEAGKVTDDGAAVKCQCCNNNLSAPHFGAVLPGSRLYYCDSPSCLVDYVRTKVRAKPFSTQPRLDLGNLTG